MALYESYADGGMVAEEYGIYASGYPLIGAAINKVRCSVRRINNVDSAYIVP